MADTQKLVFMVTHGPRDPELATIPFVMAGAALASDVAVAMGFQGAGVELMQKGVAEGVAADAFPPLAQLIDEVRDLGGQFLVCGPCIKNRHISASDDLIEGTEVVAAGRFIAEVTSATSSLVY
jgi:predicted peroxiredoxin